MMILTFKPRLKPGLVGHVRQRWCQLRFIAHDRTVPALEVNTRPILYSKTRTGGAVPERRIPCMNTFIAQATA